MNNTVKLSLIALFSLFISACNSGATNPPPAQVHAEQVNSHAQEEYDATMQWLTSRMENSNVLRQDFSELLQKPTKKAIARFQTQIITAKSYLRTESNPAVQDAQIRTFREDVNKLSVELLDIWLECSQILQRNPSRYYITVADQKELQRRLQQAEQNFATINQQAQQLQARFQY